MGWRERVAMVTSGPAWPSLWASSLLLAGLVPVVMATDDDVTPRISFPYDAVGRSLRSFSAAGVSNFTSLLLSYQDDRLYAGARETLFSLSLQDITSAQPHKTLTWGTTEKKREECSFKGKDPQTDCFNYIKILLRLNSTHLFVCGTYAFSPACAYINTSSFSLERDAAGEVMLEDGRSRCPFNPEHKSTAIIVDGELYTGTVSNFQGNEPTIYKSLGSGTALKTENSLNWLQDPAFVGSAVLSDGSVSADDESVYFFFSETGKEFDFFDNTIVSRIARVCKDDLGGERILQKKWTSFLKAQLLCSLPADGFPFNIIQDTHVLPAQHRDHTLLYAIFTSQWNKGVLGSSAVCVFSMSQVDAAFSGRYREVNRESQQWYTHTQPPPEPRPGACITNSSRQQGIESSLDMPDKVLNFVKDHFLMETVIRSQPVLLKQNVRYTQIAVHRIKGLHRAYDVMFIGTDDGRLHKAVNTAGRMHIIEEISLFPEPQPVLHIELDSHRAVLFVSSYSGLVQLPVSNCSFHQGCGECVLARDPYCAWTGTRCADLTHTRPDSQWQQAVEEADTSVCNKATPIPRSAKPPPTGALPCQVIVIPANTFRVLPCTLRSNHAHRKWEYSQSAGHFLYPAAEGGLVVLGGRGSQETAFACWSEEHGFRRLLANYCVRAEPRAKSTTPIGPRALPDPPVILPGKSWRSARPRAKTYRTELICVCTLLGACVLGLAVCVAYRHRGRMKVLLRGPEQPSMHQKNQGVVGKLAAESLPLNGSTLAASTSDHNGYQTLQDNGSPTHTHAHDIHTHVHGSPTHTHAHDIHTHVHGSPTHTHGSPACESLSELSKSCAECESRPLGVKQSDAESSPTSPRPRVRLGSEIRDSVV